MRVWVVVCEEWLRGGIRIAVVGVYRSREDARLASLEDSFAAQLGRRLAYEMVEVEVVGLWERTWRWLERWVDAAPWPRV